MTQASGVVVNQLERVSEPCLAIVKCLDRSFAPACNDVLKLVLGTCRVTIGIACLAIAQTSVAREQAQWITSPDVVEVGQEFAMQTTFEIEKLPEHAELRCAVDFCVATIELNGDVVAEATPYDDAQELSVSRWCVLGRNTLVIRVVASGGPTAAALELSLRSTDDQQSKIVSNERWVTVGASPEPVRLQGAMSAEVWWESRRSPQTTAFDEYNQWSEAKGDHQDHRPVIHVPDGFILDEVYRVPERYGSWISMTIDDRNRFIVGREKNGVFRLDLRDHGEPPSVEVLNADLQGNHGVLWTSDGLFVNASDMKGFFRLRDTNGDDRYDEVKKLRSVPGGGGDHGRNDLVVGRDNELYLIHGDAVDLPDGFATRVPVTQEFQDGLPRGGHVIRTDPSGANWEVVVAGLRNPYGIAVHRDGELFTYDADSERHVGLPWYRPTRMNHLVQGADYGWRSRNQLPFPIYLTDFLPPNVLIGRGSPTSVRFGYTSSFPDYYRDTLFAPDWAFGRVFAVHVIPRGASYSMHPEVFLQGRPFNVVDIDFLRGDMYLLTGGYGTRSTLYRLRYTGPQEHHSEVSKQQRARAEYSKQMRELRRQLEAFHRDEEGAVAVVWDYLGHADRWIRHAARIALEHQPVSRWTDRLWTEQRVDRFLPAMLAYVRMAPDVDVPRVCRALQLQASVEESPEHRQIVTRILEWLVDSHGLDAATGGEIYSVCDNWYASGSRSLDRELCSLLTGAEVSSVVPKTLQLLAQPQPPEDVLHYLLQLSRTSTGWTHQRRSAYFRLLEGAKRFQGDEGLPQFVQTIIDDALKQVPESDRQRCIELLSLDAGEQPAPTAPRAFVRKWTVSDLVEAGTAGGDRALGKKIFHQAMCVQCHRFGDVGRAMGPDLTGLAARFRREEILKAILEPSKSISSRYVNHVIVTEDGRALTGQVVWNGFRKSILRVATDPFRMDKVVEVAKRTIVSHEPSRVSPMPEGLLDTFQRNEIQALLAYLDSDMPH